MDIGAPIREITIVPAYEPVPGEIDMPEPYTEPAPTPDTADDPVEEPVPA